MTSSRYSSDIWVSTLLLVQSTKMGGFDRVVFISAWLFFLVMNTGRLATLIKTEHQRTLEEEEQIARGLFRVTCLEFFILVPASAALLTFLRPVFMAIAPMLRTLDSGTLGDHVAASALVGMCSYGFPFAALRDRISRALLAATTQTNSPGRTRGNR